MRKHTLALILTLSGFMVLTGCKPTEKNYKAAYDVALAKRQAEQNDPDMNLPVDGYQRLDAPKAMKVGDKEYDYQFVRLKPLDDSVKMNPYNVAVSVFKMPTNCEAQVSDLKESGYDAFGARSGDDKYYVIVGSFTNLEAAAAAIDNYVKIHKDSVYVGLSDNPVIVQTAR